jgi:hypothetical protein
MINRSIQKTPLFVLFVSVATFIVAYYLCILLHEWGHGTAAWFFGQKNSPFDIYYGGLALLHVDENVDYAKLLAANKGWEGAIIGISGITVSAILFVISLICMARSSVQKNIILFSLLYWALVLNMVPLLQYLSLTTFSSGGDVGQFTHGLNISPWWIFIPGTITVIVALRHIFRVEVPRAYAVIPVRSLWGRRLFLLATLVVIFLLIYTHGYNPLTDKGTNLPSKLLAVFSLLLVPILFFVCDPSRTWVKSAVQSYK